MKRYQGRMPFRPDGTKLHAHKPFHLTHAMRVLTLAGMASVSMASAWASMCTSALARSLPQAVELRSARATVKVVALGDDGQGRTGSGVIIDSRGYVLTSFRVVGYSGFGGGMPGTLINPDNRYFVGTVNSVNDTARPEWLATVVRADPTLDLALLRIVSDANGQRLGNTRFDTMGVAPLGALKDGTAAWTFGFPKGSRKLTLKSNNIAAVRKNAFGQPTWIKLGSAVDAGYSGGPLVDPKGRLLGLPSSAEARGSLKSRARYARAAVQMPAAWRQALRRGHLTSVNIKGPQRLNPGQVLSTPAHAAPHPEENHTQYFLLGMLRQGSEIEISPGLPAKVTTLSGRVVASTGSGRIKISQPASSWTRLLAVNVGKQASQMRVELLPPGTRRSARSPRRSTGSRAGNSADSGALAALGAPRSVENPFFTSPGTKRQASRPTPQPRGQKQSGTRGLATVSGRIVDAVTGRPVSGATFVIGERDVNVRSHVRAYLAGRLSERAFRDRLVGLARTDLFGRFKVDGVPRSGRFPAAAIAKGYGPSVLTLSMKWHDASRNMGTIELAK